MLIVISTAGDGIDPESFYIFSSCLNCIYSTGTNNKRNTVSQPTSCDSSEVVAFPNAVTIIVIYHYHECGMDLISSIE